MSKVRWALFNILVERFSRASEGPRIGKREEGVSRTLAAQALNTVREDDPMEAAEKLDHIRENLELFAIPGYALRTRAALAIAYSKLGREEEMARELKAWEQHWEDVWPEFRPVVAALMVGATGAGGSPEDTYVAVERAVEASEYMPGVKDEDRYRWKGFGAAAAAMTLGTASDDLHSLVGDMLKAEGSDGEQAWVTVIVCCLLAMRPKDDAKSLKMWIAHQIGEDVPEHLYEAVAADPIAAAREALLVVAGDADRFKEELLTIWATTALVRLAMKLGAPPEFQDFIAQTGTALAKTRTLASRGWLEIGLWEIAGVLEEGVPMELPAPPRPDQLAGLWEILRGGEV